MLDLKNKIYESKIVDIGSDAQEFKNINMLIFFGNEAPKDLRSSCFIIKVNSLKGEIKKGQTIRIADNEYKITAVGDEVNRNFNNLGHMSVKFTGETRANMPGSIYVEKKKFPDIKVGSKVIIY